MSDIGWVFPDHPNPHRREVLYHFDYERSNLETQYVIADKDGMRLKVHCWDDGIPVIRWSGTSYGSRIFKGKLVKDFTGPAAAAKVVLNEEGCCGECGAQLVFTGSILNGRLTCPDCPRGEDD